MDKKIQAPQMRHVVCWECDGKGWQAPIGLNYLPEKETCTTCNGERTLHCTEEFFQGYGTLKEVEPDGR